MYFLKIRNLDRKCVGYVHFQAYNPLRKLMHTLLLYFISTMVILLYCILMNCLIRFDVLFKPSSDYRKCALRDVKLNCLASTCENI